MKQVLYIFLCLISFQAKAQTTAPGKIELETADSRTGNWFPYNGGHIIAFYKLPENKLAFRINVMEERESPVLRDSIPVSEYQLIYKNRYGQEVKKKFRVNTKEVTRLALNPDSLLSYPQHTLSKLRDGDTIAISFKSQGCFNYDVEKLIIEKKRESFVAEFYKMVRFTPAGLKNQKRRMKSAVLTKQNINDFIRFENELNYAGEDGCTTTDQYEVKSRYLNIKMTDGGCSWNGFYYLKKAIFGKMDD